MCFRPWRESQPAPPPPREAWSTWQGHAFISSWYPYVSWKLASSAKVKCLALALHYLSLVHELETATQVTAKNCSVMLSII